MPGFLSSRPNSVPPPPHTLASVAPPSLGPIQTKGQTLWYSMYILINPSTGQMDDVNAGKAGWVTYLSANFFAKQMSEKPSRDGRVDEGQRTGERGPQSSILQIF
jgi:hypothetical protein